jgi:hypothetical protein
VETTSSNESNRRCIDRKRTNKDFDPTAIKRHKLFALNQTICLCISVLTGGLVVMGDAQMATASSVETRETASLIASDKVEGTAVYGSDEQKIGEIERMPF